MALVLACVASVSVWFRSKKRLWKGIFGFDRARNNTRTNPLPALLFAPFFAWSVTLVPCSLLLKGTETLATRATLVSMSLFFSTFSVKKDLAKLV